MKRGKSATGTAQTASEQLAIDGGKPVRTEPLPLEFPGVHYLGDEETEAALRVLGRRSLFRYYGIDLGREVESLESEFAQFVGVAHAVAVSSGTGALVTALSALGVGPGQEVIIPAYLWVSVAAAVVNQGAIPVLADIDETFCLDPAEVTKRITSKTAGIIAVHMSGAPADIKPIREIARARGVFLLEDFPPVGLRKIIDPQGDTGCFLITTYPDAPTAERVNRALRAEGIVTSPQGVSDVVMATDWGLHIYYNNLSLVNKASVDGRGFPWNLAENAGLGGDYAKGTCPVADSLFERSIILAIPSCLPTEDEDDIIHAFEKVLRALL